MIESTKARSALLSIHDILVLTRDMGYRGEEGGVIARVLDAAEHLIILVADIEDRTTEFEQALVDLAARDKIFLSVVDRFKRDSAR
jgi:hypothetical protein